MNTLLSFVVSPGSEFPATTNQDAKKQTQTMGLNPNSTMTAVQKLRAMLADPDKFIACPGVYDGFTARIALQEGVDCLYMVRRYYRPYTTPRGATTEN